MHWAKTQSKATYNLALSDMSHFPLEELPIRFERLQVTGPGGYGYPPLIQAIGMRYGVGEECVVLSVGTSLANHIAMTALEQWSNSPECASNTKKLVPLYLKKHAAEL